MWYEVFIEIDRMFGGFFIKINGTPEADVEDVSLMDDVLVL